MQALSQLSYGPTWRRGTLPDTHRFVKEMNGLRATGVQRPAQPRQRLGFAQNANVASIGGDTVPPHTASRIGCASLPRADTVGGRKARRQLVNRRRRPVAECSKFARQRRPAIAAMSGAHVLAHRLLVVGLRARGKRTRCWRPSRAASWRARAAPATICSSCASSRWLESLPAPDASASTGTMRAAGVAHHVLLIEPRQLFGIESRGRLVDIRDVEQPHHLLDA